MKQPTPYGGQALIEGVMIRGATCISIALRRPDGTLLVLTEPIGWTWARRWRAVPFLRGIIVLAEMVAIGTKALLFSALVASEEETPAKSDGGALPSVAVGGTLALSLLIVLALFFALPVLIARPVEVLFTSTLLSNLVEGVARLAIFIAYIAAIGLMPSVRRVFAYHGAEHMAVHAHEHGQPLTIEAVRRYPTAHPRCGTAFILVVLLLAVLAHVLVDTLLGAAPLWERVLSRLLVLPLLAGLSYELIRWSGAHASSPLVRLLILPNLALQRLTTRTPDEGQIEVAIQALEAARTRDALAQPT